jgi:hypothetical protein
MNNNTPFTKSISANWLRNRKRKDSLPLSAKANYKQKTVALGQGVENSRCTSNQHGWVYRTLAADRFIVKDAITEKHGGGISIMAQFLKACQKVATYLSNKRNSM